LSNYNEVARNIIGRIAMTQPEAEIIEAIAARVSTWVEIGCLWGGSAILAALANPGLRIYTIDPFGKYYDGDLSVETVLDNFMRFNVAHQVSIIKARSSPWPLPKFLRVDAILIDGDHTIESVNADYESALAFTNKFILFHDYDDVLIHEFIHANVRLKVHHTSKRMIAFELRD